MTRPQETFTDMLARLFPMPGIQLGINSPHSKCITFQVTEDCNLRCSYCYQGCKTHRKMSLETAKAAVDMLLAADERTNQYITSTEVAGVVLDFIGAGSRADRPDPRLLRGADLPPASSMGDALESVDVHKRNAVLPPGGTAVFG